MNQLVIICQKLANVGGGLCPVCSELRQAVDDDGKI